MKGPPVEAAQTQQQPSQHTACAHADTPDLPPTHSSTGNRACSDRQPMARLGTMMETKILGFLFDNFPLGRRVSIAHSWVNQLKTGRVDPVWPPLQTLTINFHLFKHCFELSKAIFNQQLLSKAGVRHGPKGVLFKPLVCWDEPSCSFFDPPAWAHRRQGQDSFAIDSHSSSAQPLRKSLLDCTGSGSKYLLKFMQLICKIINTSQKLCFFKGSIIRALWNLFLPLLSPAITGCTYSSHPFKGTQ